MKWFLGSILLCLFIKPAFTQTSQLLVPYLKANGQFIYTDISLRPIISTEYEYAGLFDEKGMAMIKKKGRYGFINRKGNEVIAAKYEDLAEFDEDMAWYKLQEGNCGFMDRTGRSIIRLKSNYYTWFSEGLAPVRSGDLGSDRYGYINKKGELIISYQFVRAEPFREELASVGIITQVKDYGHIDYLTGFIDKSGKEVITPKYNGADGFSEGLSCVYYLREKEGKANMNDSMSVDEWVKAFEEYFVSDDAGFEYQSGFIDREGRERIPLKYSNCRSFKNGMAAVKQKNNWGFIDKQGKVILPFMYKDAAWYEEGAFCVRQGKNWGVINANGQWLISPVYTSFGQFRNGLAKVSRIDNNGDSLTFYIDKRGNEYRDKETVLANVEKEKFRSVKIGSQVWMAENLNVDHFQNGDLIPEAKTAEEWIKAGKQKKPAWCYFENNSSNGERLGKLYNWYAVHDPRGLAPKGWHVPNDAEWTKLTDYLGGEDTAGVKLKSADGWPTGGNGTNESGFTAIPGGIRDFLGGFIYGSNSAGHWWTFDEINSSNAGYRYIDFEHKKVFNNKNGAGKIDGFSVRCIKD